MGFDGWNFEAALRDESLLALLLSLAEGRQSGAESLGGGDAAAMALALHHWIHTQIDLVDGDSDGRSPIPSLSSPAESISELNESAMMSGVSRSSVGRQQSPQPQPQQAALPSPVLGTINTTTQFSAIFTAVVFAHHVSIVSASIVMCRLMKAAYSCWADECNPSPSILFPTRKHLVLFTRHLIDSLLGLVRGLGSDFVSEVIRFGNTIEECSDWQTTADLQSGFDPWDFGVGDSLPHYGSSGIKSVEQLEEGVSSFGQTSKQAENALRNERKDYFDEFNNLLRRFARVQGQDDDGEELARFLRTDFPTIVHEILAMHVRNIPWLAQLFLSRFLEVVQCNEESHVSQDEMRQTLGLDKNVDKDTFSKLSRRIEPSAAATTTAAAVAAASSSSAAVSSSSSASTSFRSSLPTSLLSSQGQQLQPQPMQHAGTFRPSPSGGGFNARLPYRNAAGGGRGRGDYGPTSPHLSSSMAWHSGRRGQSKAPDREDLSAILAQLRAMFPPTLLVFALFLYEANNARFHAQCTASVLSAIQQLSMGTEAGMSASTRPFLVPDLHRGQRATVLGQLRHLGRLLGFLHFHHLAPIAVARVDDEVGETPFALLSVPLLPLIDEATRSGRLCWTLPWVCAFLRTVGAYCQTAPFLGYAQVLAHLRSLEVRWLGLGRAVSSHRLMQVMEIQSVWEVLPAAKRLAPRSTESLSSMEVGSDGEPWPLRMEMLRSLSAELVHRLSALQRVHLLPRAVASVEGKKDGLATAARWPPGLLPPPGLSSPSPSPPSAPTPSLFLSAPVAATPVRRPKQRVSTVFVELPESSATTSLTFNLAPLTLQPVPAAGTTPVSPLAPASTVSTSASLAGLTSLALHSPEARRSAPRSPSSLKASSTKKRSATTTSTHSTQNGVHVPLSSSSSLSERPRAGSACSSQASSQLPSSSGLERRKLRTPARQVFPDDETKEVADLLEAAFWTQHSHLQRVHAFAYTHCHHASIAQIKEFVAVSLRSINAEVDGHAPSWLDSLDSPGGGPLASSPPEEWERTVADRWTGYYLSRLQLQGQAMLGALYTGATHALSGLYSHYPDPPRVARLALHYTSMRLRGQETAMLEHLNEYTERKIRELYDKKRKVLVVQAAQRVCRTGPSLARPSPGRETDEPITGDFPAHPLPSSIPSNAAEPCIAFLPAKRVELGEACAGLHSTLACLARHGCLEEAGPSQAGEGWCLASQTDRAVPVHWRVQLMLQGVLKMLARLPVLLRGVGCDLCVPWAGRQTAVDSARPASALQGEVHTALRRLRRLVCDLPHALQAVLSTGSSESLVDQTRIEVGLFLISALPYVLAMDTLPPPPAPSSSSSSSHGGEVSPWAMTEQLVAVSLARDLASLRLLSLASLCRLVTALRRDKSAAFYERAKGLPGAAWMIPEGVLLVFAHVVVHMLALDKESPDEMLVGCRECGLHTALPSSKDVPSLLAATQSLLQECQKVNKWMG